MKHPILLWVLLGLLSPAVAQRPHHPIDPFAGLDTVFARVLRDWHAAGFAVAVVEKKKVIYSRGYGYRDVESRQPVTPHTIFAIGSCTKAFTAALIGQLDRQGRLDIDKPVRDYLPELKFYNETMNSTITLRDMMCHRTGLPRHDYAWYLFNSGSRDSLIHRIQFQEPTAGVREKWQYNNFMFLAQGMVVQKLTDSSWESNVAERLFKPLGMTESDLSVNDLQKAPEAAIGYELKKDSLIQRVDYHDVEAIAPAGAINSSVNDMAAWVATWVNGGKYRDKEILPASYINEAISAQMVSGGGVPSREAPDIFFSSYGFGWSLASYRGHYRVEHGGNIDGFTASTCLFPSDSIGIVVLCNQSSSQVPAIVRNFIADRLLRLGYKDWSTYLKSLADKGRADARAAASARVASVRSLTHPSHPLDDYAGIYSNPGYGSMEVVAERDSLWVNFPHIIWWLRHSHYDVFDPLEKDPKAGIDTADDGPLKVQFNMDQGGNINSISMNIEPALNKPIFFSRTPRPSALTPADLQRYAGEYQIANVIIKCYVKNETTLYLVVPGQPEYELVPVAKDKFVLKTLPNFEEQFVADEKGEISAILSVQPNGTFKAVRKKQP